MSEPFKLPDVTIHLTGDEHYAITNLLLDYRSGLERLRDNKDPRFTEAKYRLINRLLLK